MASAPTSYPPSTLPTSPEPLDKAEQDLRSPDYGPAVFGSEPSGVIGKHKPREIIRVERDYAAGEALPQFWSGFPPELQGRITPTEHSRTMNQLNAILASAFDPYNSIVDNILAIFTLYLSTFVLKSHYQRKITEFQEAIFKANRDLYNPAGLNLLDPRPVAFLFLEVEYY